MDGFATGMVDLSLRRVRRRRRSEVLRHNLARRHKIERNVIPRDEEEESESEPEEAPKSKGQKAKEEESGEESEPPASMQTTTATVAPPAAAPQTTVAAAEPPKEEEEESDDSDDEEEKEKEASAGSSSTGTTLTPAVGGSSGSSASIGAASQVQSGTVSGQGSGLHGATLAAVVVGALIAISLLGFLIWRFYRRRRRHQSNDEYETGSTGKVLGPKSDIRIMNEAMAAVYAAEGGNRSSKRSRYTAQAPSGDYDDDARSAARTVSDNGTVGRIMRRLRQITNRGPTPEAQSPQDARVAQWMDRHTSRMMNPMSARASMVSSVPTNLGPPPSISPASVVGGNRESMLSEMGQIRRDAVPPPLDPALLDRARRMQQEQQEQQERQEVARNTVNTLASSQAVGWGMAPAPAPTPPSPTYSGVTAAQSRAGTESTWNTWGVEQHQNERQSQKSYLHRYN